MNHRTTAYPAESAVALRKGRKLVEGRITRKIIVLNIVSMFIFISSYANQSTTRVISQEVQEYIIQMEKDIYVWYPDELCELLEYTFIPAPTITAAQLKERMAQEKDLVVINVLSERIHTDCHIEGSINVPLHKILQTVAEWDRDKKIVVYCALEECDASEKGYILLSALGFNNVTEYPGGILEWYQLGYPVTGPCALSYLHEKTKALQLCHPNKEHAKLRKN